jgi:hypothetical protein
LVDELNPAQTVSLTATPPYDVDYSEWERYEELCGPIDEVISIPELVSNGDLCPHQDFIHFSLLRENENEMLKKQIGSDRAFFVGQDISFIAGLMAHIQLSLLGCAGYIVIADTIRYPVYGGLLSPRVESGQILYTPVYYTDVWQIRKGIEYARYTLHRQTT